MASGHRNRATIKHVLSRKAPTTAAPAARQELSSQLPLAPGQESFLKNRAIVSPHLKPYLDHVKIHLHSRGTTTCLLFHCQELVKTRPCFTFWETARQVILDKVMASPSCCYLPIKASEPSPPGLCGRMANPHKLSPNCKTSKKLISVQQKPPLRSTRITGIQLNFSLCR